MNAVSLVSLTAKASGGFGVLFVVVGFCVVVVSLVGLVWFFVVFVLPLLLCMPSIFH